MHVEFWEPQIERIKLKDLKALQLKRLRAQLRRVYENSPFYRRRFKEAGVTPDDLKSLDDLRKFPFTTKDDLRAHGYPYGGEFLAVPFEELVGWHMTSGTTGKPTVGPYTKADIELWTNLVARCLVAAGVTKRDILLNIYGYGLFTGGLGLHYGAMAVGAKVIPWGVGRTEALVDLIYEWKPTVMTGTPSYQLYILETIQKKGLDPKKASIRITIPGAEAMSFEMLKRIDEGFGLKEKGGGPRQIYGSTEIIGPGAGQATPCTEYIGFHMWTDHIYIEIIDPKTGEPVGEEGEGELVITHLTREGMPLIRYRQRDIVKVQYLSTDCGRDAFPVVHVIGRVDDVIFYKGTKIYPSAIQAALMKVPEVLEYQVIIDKRGAEHKFIIRAEVLSQNPEIAETIANVVEGAVFARPQVELVPPNTLPRWEGKSKRVVVYE
ncbi:MAG: phenylacetate--CoA ligase [Thermofilaceae archaeon]